MKCLGAHLYVRVHNACVRGVLVYVCSGEPNSDQQASASVVGEEEGGAVAKTDGTPAEGDEVVTWNSLGRRVRQLCIDFSPKVMESTTQTDCLSSPDSLCKWNLALLLCVWHMYVVTDIGVQCI